MKTKYIVLIGLFCFIAGFFIGQKTISFEPVVKYIKGDPIAATISAEQLKPVETIPDKPVLPMIPDTIYLDSLIYITQKVDTAAIIADYIIKRNYRPILFDNPKLGRLTVNAVVQYNKMDSLDYEFTPIQKEITIYKEKVWVPVVRMSYNTFNQVTFSGGSFYHDLELNFQYIYDFNRNEKAYGLGVGYKF